MSRKDESRFARNFLRSRLGNNTEFGLRLGQGGFDV